MKIETAEAGVFPVLAASSFPVFRQLHTLNEVACASAQAQHSTVVLDSINGIWIAFLRGVRNFHIPKTVREVRFMDDCGFLLSEKFTFQKRLLYMQCTISNIKEYSRTVLLHKRRFFKQKIFLKISMKFCF